MLERRAFYITAFVRAVTTSLVGVLIGVYLARQGIAGAALGTIVSAGLVGAALAAVVATFLADRIAAVLFLLREGLVEMDVPTRQSYVLAVVQPEERTFASGITNLVRLGAWAVAPAFAGALVNGDSVYLPLVIGAGMKITHDLLLWHAFRGIRPPEEVAS